MTTKACRFCNNDMVAVPLVIGTRTLEVYFCYTCQSEYVDWGGIVSIHLYTQINNKTYRWSIEENGNVGRLWHVAEPGIPGERPNRKLKLVKYFKHFPNITPSNVERKLKFMLLFL